MKRIVAALLAAALMTCGTTILAAPQSTAPMIATSIQTVPSNAAWLMTMPADVAQQKLLSYGSNLGYEFWSFELLSVVPSPETTAQRVERLRALQFKPTTGSIGAILQDVSAIDLVQEDGSRYRYTMREGGVEISYLSLDGKKSMSGLFTVDATAYKALLAHARTVIRDYTATPMWLTVMRPQLHTKLHVKVGKNTLSLNRNDNDRDCTRMFSAMSFFFVDAKVPAVEVSKKPKNAPAYIKLDFSTGITYEMYATSDTLTIFSSDRPKGLRYKHTEKRLIDTLAEMAQGIVPPPMTGKPVIYLYPEQPTNVSVTLRFAGQLSETLPLYDADGWQVTAYPDGRLVDPTDGTVYPYLFWDGNSNVKWDLSQGFVVKGNETRSFLNEKLTYLGLNASETAAFIEYWLPEMERNAYNLISFSGAQYQQLARMQITPTPDSLLRVHMVYKPLDAPIPIQEQELPQFKRIGFAAVEWGGTRAF